MESEMAAGTFKRIYTMANQVRNLDKDNLLKTFKLIGQFSDNIYKYFK